MAASTYRKGMDATSPSLARLRSLRALPISLLVVTIALSSGCGGKRPTEQELQAVRTELETANGKAAAAEKKAEEKSDQLDLAKSELAKAKSEISDRDSGIAKRDAQIAALQRDVEKLKAQDGALFAEAATMRKQGLTLSALEKYQKLVADYPQSPLADYATVAINELNAERSRAAQKRVDEVVAAKRPEQQVLKYFGDGQTTLAELAPILKSKTVAQVAKMIGRPDRTFNEGNEFGYADKVLNPATNRPGMLIIGFVDGVVANIRVEYSGRKIVP
jgi:hypothetical protein